MIIELEDFDDFDLEAFMKDFEKKEATKKLRKDRPWAYDIIRVLWGSRSWIVKAAAN
jgi:hypothetical protein